MPPITHQVQAGDTVSAIAKRFNVPVSSVSGFRSNDPNVIFPGETLNIQQPEVSPTIQPDPTQPQAGAVVDGSALKSTGVLTPTPALPTSTEGTANITPSQPPQDAGAGAITETIKQLGEQAQAPTIAVAPAPVTETQVLADQTFEQAAAGAENLFTPSGLEISPEGDVVNSPEEQLDNALGQFGISGEAVAQGFQTNPFGTISDIVQQVMQATGLPDVREQVTNTANEIEELELERDKQIADIQDDPFSSVGSKRQRSQNISDAFDKRINARVNKLTLLQSGQETARKQAQFAATTAINLFGKQQEFQADEIERILDREEKQLEAQAKLNEPLSVSEAKALGVPFGTTQKEAFGITPSADVFGFTEEDIANNIIKIRTSIKSEQGFKDFTDILNAFQNTKVGFNLDNAAGDLAMVNGIAKILDPGSVVRPAEFETVRAAQGFFEQVANFPFKVSAGRIVGQNARARFLELSEQLVLEKAGPLKTNLESSFGLVASGLGVDLRQAVPEIQQLEDITRDLAGKKLISQTKKEQEIVTPEIQEELNEFSFKAPSSFSSFISKIFGN